MKQINQLLNFFFFKLENISFSINKIIPIICLMVKYTNRVKENVKYAA